MKIAANGITLHAEESGAGDLTLVFLHYWGGTSSSWKHVTNAMPETLRSISLDARGWGQSDRPEAGYDIATMTDDLAAAITQLGLKRYVLVGHSMGGKVAQLLASRRPAGLAGLVLVAPSPAQGKSLPEQERAGMAGAYVAPEAAAWTIDNILTELPLPPPVRELEIAGYLAGAAPAKAFWPANAISEDVSAGLAHINVPILVIGGEKDKVDSVDMLQNIVLPALPGATMTVIPGAGHLLPLEAPRELVEQIVGFIVKRVGTPRAEDIATAFDAAFNSGDLEALLGLFHPKAIMRMTDGTTVAEGLDALREALGGLLALQPKLRNSVRRVLLSDDVALLLLDWEIRVTVPGQGEVVESGTATQIAERGTDGNWRLRISNPPGIN
jgi:uncharacterized protein (TIGR02246 family)